MMMPAPPAGAGPRAGVRQVADRGKFQDYASGLDADRGPGDRWLSVYEAAAMTLQHPRTIRRWIEEGMLKAEDRGRLGYRVPESEVERFVNEVVRTEGRSPANKGLSSNLVTDVHTDTPVERRNAKAGWPFFGDAREDNQT